MTSELQEAVETLRLTFGDNPLTAIRRLELDLQAGKSLTALHQEDGISAATLLAALALKKVAGQVNVMVHASGILTSLPHILEDGEVIQSVSLGAGNTGKVFDLETDRRIAEFKFISWRGGPEAIRQNQLFKDFLKLLWADTSRKRQLCLTGTSEAIAFLRGGRALTSVLSRNVRLGQQFAQRYGSRYKRVGEFYRDAEGLVELVDLNLVVPALRTREIPPEAPALEAL